MDRILISGIVLTGLALSFSVGFMTGVIKTENYLEVSAVSGYVDIKKVLYKVHRAEP